MKIVPLLRIPSNRALRHWFAIGLASLVLTTASPAAGLLKSAANDRALYLKDHQVKVLIEGGYARTSWSQIFVNSGPSDLEAIYEVPLPREATLAEVRLIQGDVVLDGEVVRRAKAQEIYRAERDAGRDAGVASQEDFRHYRFQIARVPANSETRLEVLYYEPVDVDTGVGTYRYALEEGGTDEGQMAFWSRDATLAGIFSIEVEVRAGAPLQALRAPGLAGLIEVLDEETQLFRWSGSSGSLDQDFVLYYQLVENLPGRVEVFVHKPTPDRDGVFLAAITPGIDLQPLPGADYVFVLDLSGSMQGKFSTLIEGVRQSISALRPQDRFRIVLFNNEAQEWTRGRIHATPENVSSVLAQLSRLQPNGGTDLYAGIELALSSLDADRATSVVLVTDAVANQGVVDPADFRRLLERFDFRFFGFLLGNSGNWPLMETLCEATGGYARAVSNQQDIVGEILLARSKIAYQSLHRAEFHLGGSARPCDLTGLRPGKIFRGEQILLMGRYREEGELELVLDAQLTGEAKRYSTRIFLPDVEPSRPELERLWALRQLREWDDASATAVGVEASELQDARIDLALEYQLVTEDTSMLLLTNGQFAQYGIERRNAERLARESAARTMPPPPVRNDAQQPMTSGRSASYGGGALDFGWIVLLLGLAAASLFATKRR